MAKGAFLEREKPVTLRIIARYLPPKSVSKKRKFDMLEGRELPLKKPDMDNIVKVVADALNGVAYHDDTADRTGSGKEMLFGGRGAGCDS